MANGLNKTKRRINSVKSTQKITKAMGMVASVKLKRYEAAYRKGKEYSSEVSSLLRMLTLEPEASSTHYAKANEGAPDFYLAITSDLGLCASYNVEIYKKLLSLLKEGDTLAPIGAKGVNHFARSPIPGVRLDFSFAAVGLNPDPRDLTKLSEPLRRAFNEGKYGHIYVVYTHYINSLRFEPSLACLLPLEGSYQKSKDEEIRGYLYEPGPRQLIHKLMAQYLSASLSSLLVEAQYSEQASRRNAMDNANDNADELLRQLSIEYNKARQGAITQEITEVTAGAKAQQS